MARACSIYMWACLFVCACICPCTYICTSICIHTYLCIYEYMYTDITCICIQIWHVCVYTYHRHGFGVSTHNATSWHTGGITIPYGTLHGRHWVRRLREFAVSSTTWQDAYILTPYTPSHTRTHTHTHARTHTHAHTHTHTHTGHFFVTCSHDRTARLWSTDHIYPLRIFAGAHTHTYTHMCTHTHTHIHIHPCGRSTNYIYPLRIFAGAHTRTYTHTYAHAYAHTCTNTYTYIHGHWVLITYIPSVFMLVPHTHTCAHTHTQT